jgi:hypothetical protein
MCHSAGVRAAYDKQTGAGWTPPDRLAEIYGGIKTKYDAAINKIIAGRSDADPQLAKDIINGTKEPTLFTSRLYEDANSLGTAFGACGSCESFCGGQFASNLCQTAPLAGRIKSANGGNNAVRDTGPSSSASAAQPGTGQSGAGQLGGGQPGTGLPGTGQPGTGYPGGTFDPSGYGQGGYNGGFDPNGGGGFVDGG